MIRITGFPLYGGGICIFILTYFILLPVTSTDSTKFKTCDKSVEKIGDQGGGGILSKIPSSKQYKAHKCTEVLQGSKFSKETGIESNGFVGTVVQAYSGHHNLVIRPDDVWTAIMVQFSFYINKEAEKFRKKFVNFEGKKTLEVTTGGTLRTVSYGSLVKQMSDLIDKNLVDHTVKEWLLPKFSTTTDDDRVTCGVVFMATMKKYFDYVFGLTCGIPYVTLEGTVEDWEEIERRLEKLKEYELEWWYDMLKPVIHQFVNAKKGKPEVDFWQKICHRESMGSGPDYLSGWITVFAVFDVDGKRQGFVRGSDPWPTIDDNDIPMGSVEVDVKINDNGVKHDSVMFAGHMGKGIESDGTTLRPTSGWVICLKPNSDDG